MNQEKYLMIREAVMAYIARTGQSRNDFVLITHPESDVMRPIQGKIPKTVVGVEIVNNNIIDKKSFVLIPREELHRIDELIVDFGLDGPYDEIVICSLCGHPINAVLSQDLETVTCPWCETENDIDEDEDEDE